MITVILNLHEPVPYMSSILHEDFQFGRDTICIDSSNIKSVRTDIKERRVEFPIMIISICEWNALGNYTIERYDAAIIIDNNMISRTVKLKLHDINSADIIYQNYYNCSACTMHDMINKRLFKKIKYPEVDKIELSKLILASLYNLSMSDMK